MQPPADIKASWVKNIQTYVLIAAFVCIIISARAVMSYHLDLNLVSFGNGDVEVRKEI